MKKILTKQQIYEYWRKVMSSTRRAMSVGAQAITKLITKAHGDNWRRKEGKK